MIKKFAISLTCGLASWSSAEACSPTPEAMTGVQNYRSITPSHYQSWFHPDLSIGLVYAKQIKQRKKKVVPNYDDKTVKKPFIKVQFNLINNISGDFVADETSWFPKIDKVGEAREHKLIDKSKNFAFWDRRDISVPQVYGYEGLTSCGPQSSNTLLPNQFYLHFKQKNRTVGLEIVSGPEDTLVKEFIKIKSGALESKISRKPINYFKEMHDYAEVVVKACPLADDFELGFGFYGSALSFGEKTPASFQLVDKFKTKSQDFYLIDFYSYIARTNNDKLECTVGDRYLIIEKLSDETLRGGRGGFSVNPPLHRYLKIDNELVDTKNILSMINLVSDNPVSSSNIKSWIREANTP